MRLSAVVAVLLLGLTACTTSPMTPSSHADGTDAGAAAAGGAGSSGFAQFSDLPVPAKATMDVDHSLLLGHGDAWVGRLVYNSWNTPSSLYDFYRNEMPGFSWQEITSVRATISVQTWQRGDRVVTIQIKENTIGCEVTMTMAPSVTPGAVGAGYAPPPPAADPTAKVSRQPLR
ncbi:MAG TPA: hypothetical protein VK558_01725 [Patescibacteria group bacterium]|nr:hypothetical protein [Patescibacteria group bacterium]